MVRGVRDLVDANRPTWVAIKVVKTKPVGAKEGGEARDVAAHLLEHRREAQRQAGAGRAARVEALHARQLKAALRSTAASPAMARK